MSLEDALSGCERILRDEFKDYPESALYMIGTIDEATRVESAASQPPPRPRPEPTAQSSGMPESPAKQTTNDHEP